MAELVARTLRRTPRWLRSLPVSLALHVAIAAVVLALLRSDQAPPALILDLTAVIAETDDGPGARGAASPPGTDRSSRASSGPTGAVAARPAPVPRGETPRPAARSVEPSPSVAPPLPAAVPPAPAAALAPPIPEARPGPVTPPPAPAPATPTASRPDTSSTADPRMPAPAGGSGTPGATGGTPSSSAGVGDARGAGGGGTGEGPGVAGPGGARFALVVPGSGTGGGPGSEYGAYLARLRQRLQEALRYPAPARRRGIAGTVQLEIAIESDGAIASVAVIASSSHDVLDRAAVEAARALSRQPFPADVRPRPLKVRLPVVFELQ